MKSNLRFVIAIATTILLTLSIAAISPAGMCCEPDAGSDGVHDFDDNCLAIPNPGQREDDGVGATDVSLTFSRTLLAPGPSLKPCADCTATPAAGPGLGVCP